ncbi:MAG: glycerophosphodiester phosphodiesterase family protein [Bacteroidales bacterium]|nr:glycerophosphodiester phosphodiesterase family protein [Bacteroidales bacterium]
MKRLLYCLAAALLLLPACGEKDTVDLTPTVSCPQDVEFASRVVKGERVAVSIRNISATTEVTVKFGNEETKTQKGPGVVYHAFENIGRKTITVTMVPAEVEKTQFHVMVEDGILPLQRVAQMIVNDPLLCLVMAHRGNSSDWSVPENSAAAIEKCIADKVDIMETDLWTSKDGHLIVSHDENLNRVTGHNQKIGNMTLAQIKQLNLKDRNGNPTTQKVLTFDELLDLCKDRLYINVDIGDRDANIPDVVEAVAKKGMTQQVLIYCNTNAKVLAALKTNPECNAYSPTGSNATYLVEQGNKDYKYFTQCTYPSTSASAVNTAVTAGTILTVNAIYTLNTSLFPAHNFTVDLVNQIYAQYPATRCLHVDTGKEARAALKAAGKHVMNDN